MRRWLILVCIAMINLLHAQSNGVTINGKVLNEYGLGLVGATVQLVHEGEQINAEVTDTEGRFSLLAESRKGYRLTASYLGYEDSSVPLDFEANDTGRASIVIQLVPAEIPISIVDVNIGRYNEQEFLPNLAHTITIDEVRKLPATFFDPARLAQSFAGVANNNDQANGISIRGNSPDHLKWYIEGVEVVNPNHTSNAGTVSDRPSQSAGGVNILSAQLLSQTQFYKSIYPAAYQNALSGIMGMSLRNGDRKKRKHFLQVGLIGLEASSEGPFSTEKKKGAYLFNYRFSTVGLLSQLGLDFGGEAIDFQDLAVNISLPTKKGMLKLFAVGGASNNVFTAPDNETEREEQKDNTNIDFSGDTGLVGLNYDTYISDRNRLNITSILSANKVTRTSTVADSIRLPMRSDADRQSMLSTKVSIDRKMSKGSLSLGVYNTWMTYDFRSINQGRDTLALADAQQLRTGLFTALDYRLAADWRWNGALNASLRKGSKAAVSEWNLEPRMHLSYRPKENHVFFIATGLYSQSHAPRVYHLRNVPGLANENLQNVKSWQNTLSYTYRWGMYEMQATSFYQYLYDVPISATNENVNFSVLNGTDGVENIALQNEGRGRNAGIEWSLRRSPKDIGWTWWLNATLYQSQYRTQTGQWRSTRFDGRYIFNGLIGKEWIDKRSKSYGVHVRANYLGGFRGTPINLMASQNEQRTVFVDEEAFSIRQGDYFRIDLSIFRRVEHKKCTSTLSLDIQNLLNRKNEAFASYDALLDRVVVKEQLGLLPILNYRIQF